MTVLQILAARFGKLQIKGFRDGYFDDSGTKLIAFTLLPVNDEDYEDLYNFHLHNKGHLMQLKEPDDRRTRNDLGDGTYTSKSIGELITDDYLKYVSIFFTGILYNNEWFISDSTCYYSEADEGLVIENIYRRFGGDGYGWNSHSFSIVQEYQEEIDYGRITQMLEEQTGRKIDRFADYKEIYSFAMGLQSDEIPKHKIKQSANYRQFTGQPWIVAYKKQELKDQMNRHFEAYINEAVFIPLVQVLKNTRPAEFCETHTLYHPDNYPLIYPHTKEQVLCIVKAIDQSDKSRLYYFLYLLSEKRIFEWTFPVPSSAYGHHSFYILNDIKKLSLWGDEFDFGNPSITMDDPVFWNEYVIKKEGDQFQYLRPVDINNNMRDIYSLF